MKVRQIVGTALVAVALSVGIASSSAMAAEEKREGGTFRYGVGTSPCAAAYTCSQYHHPSRTHNATACGPYDWQCSSSAWVGANVNASVNILKYASGNRAFYNLT
jgi:hypothetical protein